MLEIYMKDGGTLGEVLEALFELECLQILEKLKSPVKAYLQLRKDGSLHEKLDGNGQQDLHEQFFSLLATLASSLGKDDPCYNVLQYSKGLKCSATTQAVSSAVTTSNILVTSAGEGVMCNDANDLGPKFDVDKAALKRPWEGKKAKDEVIVCRVLLVFSEDGQDTAATVEEKIQDFTHKVSSNL